VTCGNFQFENLLSKKHNVQILIKYEICKKKRKINKCGIVEVVGNKWGGVAFLKDKEGPTLFLTLYRDATPNLIRLQFW
jgi:hypothetical protein